MDLLPTWIEIKCMALGATIGTALALVIGTLLWADDVWWILR